MFTIEQLKGSKKFNNMWLYSLKDSLQPIKSHLTPLISREAIEQIDSYCHYFPDAISSTYGFEYYLQPSNSSKKKNYIFNILLLSTITPIFTSRNIYFCIIYTYHHSIKYLFCIDPNLAFNTKNLCFDPFFMHRLGQDGLWWLHIY